MLIASLWGSITSFAYGMTQLETPIVSSYRHPKFPAFEFLHCFVISLNYEIVFVRVVRAVPPDALISAFAKQTRKPLEPAFKSSMAFPDM